MSREPPGFRQVQSVLAFAAGNLDRDLSLETLARRANLSAFHLQRLFLATARETPKQLTLRLRLERAAVLLLTGRDSILNIALACGFQSHEVFCRAFRRRFGLAPGAYRKRGLTQPAGTRLHADVVAQTGPCIGLFHINGEKRSQPHMTYSIAKKTLAAQPVLVIRRRVKLAGNSSKPGRYVPAGRPPCP